MLYLVDTNVLLRFADRRHPLHSAMRGAVRKLRAAGDNLQAAAQNFIEFWNVATRPTAQNGLGVSLADTERLLRLLERLFPLLADSVAVYFEWRRLVTTFGVSGVQVHDARLVATMVVHGINHILTLNTADFARYGPAGIVAVDPQTV